MTEVANTAESSPDESNASLSLPSLQKATKAFGDLIEESGVYVFTMGFGAALISLACLMKVGYHGWALTHTLTSGEFFVMVFGGIGLLVAGAAYRYLQLRAAEAQIDKAVGLLEEAAEFRRAAAAKAATELTESGKAEAEAMQRAADIRESYAKKWLDS